MSLSAAHDEMVDGGGRLRPHWSHVLGAFRELGEQVMAERVRALDAVLAEEGNAALLPGAAPTSRRLDPFPLPIAAAEFRALEAGLAQRARLLNLLLEDVYGPQRLLAEGLLPPALVAANPAFLRPGRRTDEVTWRGGQRLHVYAADLIRGPDGGWRVLADRTADAAGAGYALLNRRALLRVMPELFRSAGIRRLQPFFDIWQDALERLAPPPEGEGDRPGLALLTPGHGDKLWYEHVVLARELSCALVEGGDLTARNGRLFLKTLRGLRQVDVLLRRQDGRTLDPLELEPGGGGRGIAGLMDAARWGGVRVLNDPGAGLAEAPGMAAFLPRLASRLLGEELWLPGAEVLWMGDAGARERVLAEPEAWRLRPALDGTVPAMPLAGQSRAEREALLGRLAANPAGFAACAALPASLAPFVTVEGRLVPRPFALRLFLVFDGAAWRALPGGLARALSEEDVRTGRLPLHTPAKDVWVATDEQDWDILGPRHQEMAPLPIRRDSGDLPSRVADDFFWLGRYLERLEGAARLLRVAVLALGGPDPTPRELAERRSLASCLAAAGLLAEEKAAEFGHGITTAAGRDLLANARDGAILPRQFGHIARLAGRLRDRLTAEVQERLTRGLRRLADALRALPTGQGDREALAAFDAVLVDILTFTAAIAGLAAENMVRGGGRLFLDLGRRLERTQAIATEMSHLLDQPGAAQQPGRLLPALRLSLELRDSVITYRSRYLSVMQPATVLDLVLADEGNPRSLAHQVAGVRDLLAALAAPDGAGGGDLSARGAALFEEVQDMALGVAQARHQAEAAAALPPRLHALCVGMGELSDAITRRYFALLPAVHSLGVEEAATPELQGTA
ncbi:circularly permuted type 2 ATP-grasp protein [Muricoccus radiodurans]|uniref:circularly permuted type 2 ATP-grasp protein n=1 Tax=Muricoccus radiodurans TaxID=2231721 RepID=UPI003CF8E68C